MHYNWITLLYIVNYFLGCYNLLKLPKIAASLMFTFFSHFSFDGRVVAKLPFVPLSYIQGLSHRNLLGEDYTDCSFIFLYILCTMSIRQVMLILCVNGAQSIMQWQFWGKRLGFDTVRFCNTCPNLFHWILVFQNIQKMLGLAPSRAATKQAGGFLGPPPQAAKFSWTFVDSGIPT